eukprot:TRINITY_DN4380_c0_g2_i5.p1 TRINITY_DN4380_c0_g2~~TRINITY_DN4380_c0_g2_i5.p1  ORF type:complete len:249 (-),score=40.11 TRINITY_DN4380_c0_g2_i5:84-830(-)
MDQHALSLRPQQILLITDEANSGSTEDLILNSISLIKLHKDQVSPHSVVETFKDKLPFAPSIFDCAIARRSDNNGKGFTLQLLFDLYRVIKADGILMCVEPISGRTFEHATFMSTNLTLAGFVDVQVSSEGKFVQTSSKKPSWELGESQDIKIKSKVPVWGLDMTDSPLMDEKELLEETDLVRPETVPFDCGSGTEARKACKNCTCGRAELEAEETSKGKKKLTLEMLDNPGVNSSCGNVCRFCLLST